MAGRNPAMHTPLRALSPGHHPTPKYLIITVMVTLVYSPLSRMLTVTITITISITATVTLTLTVTITLTLRII